MRELRSSAAAGMGGRLFGRVSLNPRPGREGMTRWKGWLVAGSSGFVRGLMRWRKERFVNGKGGIRSRGIALSWGERAWMKCSLIGEARGGREMAVRNWGSVLLRVLS